MSAKSPASLALMRVIVLAARPKTLLLALSPVLLGSAAAYGEGQMRLWVLLAAMGGAFAIQIGTNFINDWADALRGTDSGERLGPLRMTSAGHWTVRQGQAATLIAFGVAAVFGTALIVRGGWPIVFVGITGLIAGWAYTAGPYPLAYHGLGELFAFLYFGPVAVMTTAYLHLGRLVPSTGPLGVSMGALAAVLLGINNLRDRAGDAAVGKKTLAVRLGAGGMRAFLIALLAIAWLAPLQGLSVGLPPRSALAGACTLPGFVYLAWQLARLDGRRLNRLLGLTSLLQCVLAVCVSLAWCLWP